jgi:hypothetical protein
VPGLRPRLRDHHRSCRALRNFTGGVHVKYLVRLMRQLDDGAMKELEHLSLNTKLAVEVAVADLLMPRLQKEPDPERLFINITTEET